MAEFEGYAKQVKSVTIDEGAKGEIKVKVYIPAEEGETDDDVSNRAVNTFFMTKAKIASCNKEVK
jgi:hypothetical protein